MESTRVGQSIKFLCIVPMKPSAIHRLNKETCSTLPCESLKQSPLPRIASHCLCATECMIWLWMMIIIMKVQRTDGWNSNQRTRKNNRPIDSFPRKLHCIAFASYSAVNRGPLLSLSVNSNKKENMHRTHNYKGRHNTHHTISPVVASGRSSQPTFH